MTPENSFVIDGLPESALNYGSGWAVVAVDVIRATTLAITAAATGRRCFPVDSLEAALLLGARIGGTLLAGEIKEEQAPDLNMNNSPAELETRRDTYRPLVLLSSSGTRLILNARGCDMLYLGCFRNSLSTGCRIINEKHARVALLGAGSRGELREEDQICCAWIGALLLRAGYRPENKATTDVLERWANAKPSACLVSKSVEYLRQSGQLADLRFILERVDDLDETFILQNDEVVMVSPGKRLKQREQIITR